MFNPEQKIINANKVIDFFGKWPSFHDSEVLKAELDRGGPSLEIKLYTFLMLKEIDGQGCYKKDKECIITMRFLSIDKLELYDFNLQNVIFNLYFEEENGFIKVNIDASYGLSSEFICKGIEIVSVENNRGIK